MYLAHPKRQLALLTIVSVAVGFAEAGVLVLVVQTALVIAGNGSAAAGSVPIANLRMSSGIQLLLAAGLGLMSIVGHFVQARLRAQTMSEVSAGTRSTAIDAFIGASWDRQARDREGALQETMSSLAENIAGMAGALVAGAASMVNLVAFLLIAALINPTAMALVLVFGASLSMLMRPLSRLAQRRSRVYVDSKLRFVEEISRATSLAMEYRAFGVERAAAARLHQMIADTARRLRATRVWSSFNETLYRDLAAMFLVVALTGMYLANGIKVAAIGSVIVLIVRGLSYSQILQGQLQQLSQNLPSLEVFQNSVRELQAEAVAFGSMPISSVESIEFRDVGYEYVPHVPTLKGISLSLVPGEIVGVVGPSGGGKSTFVQVLLRLRPPRSGVVLVNGRPYEQFDQDDWAHLMALVSQEPRLMEASLADNISFLRKGISLAQIEQAADDAHVASDIRRLEAGFDTMLGSRGLGLSGGQKQRLAIARALVGQPKILVLDEPTSALDVTSERLLQATIGSLKGSVTMVIVAHRLSTLDVCDRILVLRDGSVEAFGTREELERQPGFYRSITSDLQTPESEQAS